uniref:Uncharacterized protein n=1 Tax=Knipowitschia caucasica TaxID=637954 RepID=A0AAV2M3L2_KNICA
MNSLFAELEAQTRVITMRIFTYFLLSVLCPSEVRKEVQGDTREVRKEVQGDTREVRKEVQGDTREVRKEVQGDTREVRVRKEVQGDTREVRKEVQGDTREGSLVAARVFMATSLRKQASKHTGAHTRRLHRVCWLFGDVVFFVCLWGGG